MPPKFGGGDKCGICDKTVYAQEKIEAGGVSFHKNCFKCSQCKMTLNLQNYGQADKAIFCKKHYHEQVLGRNSQTVS
ncbi:hypothetical protein BsWGS_08579 [Bradybaena similaris]